MHSYPLPIIVCLGSLMKYAVLILENALLLQTKMDGYHYMDSWITRIRSVFK